MSKKFTLQEVAKHNKASDIWLVIHNKVYDVTKFLDEHPGGEEVLVDLAGKNASQQYDDVGHSDESHKLMEKFYIGDVDGATPTAASIAYNKAAAATSGTSSAAKKNSNADSSIATYAVPLVFIVVIFVAAKYFGVL